MVMCYARKGTFQIFFQSEIINVSSRLLFNLCFNNYDKRDVRTGTIIIERNSIWKLFIVTAELQ